MPGVVLAQPLDFCRDRRGILVIAKLDRLARNATSIANLMKSGVEFVAVDMPRITATSAANATRFRAGRDRIAGTGDGPQGHRRRTQRARNPHGMRTPVAGRDCARRPAWRNDCCQQR